MLKILFCFFLGCFLYASPILIDEDFSHEIVHKKTFFLETEKSSFEQIKDLDFAPLEKTNFGYQGTKKIWTKTTLKNISDFPKELFIFNPRAGQDIVDMYVTINGEILKSYHMGDTQSFYNRPLQTRFSGINIILHPSEIIDLYVMLSNQGPIVPEILIYSLEDFVKQETQDLILVAILFTLISLIMIFSSILLKSIDTKSFILYTTYTFFMMVHFAAMYGIIFFLSNGKLAFLQNFLSSYGLLISAMFFLYFDLTFFNIKTIAPKLYQVVSVYLHLVFLLLSCTLYLSNELGLVVNFILVFLSISLVLYAESLLLFTVYKKLKYSIYYFMGHSFYLIGVSLYIAYVLGILEESWITRYAGMFGIICEGLILVKGMHTTISKEMDDKQNIERLLVAQSRFFATGKQIATIVHQWKLPLNRISTIMMYLESKVNDSSAIHQKDLIKGIHQANQIIAFMSNTMNTFQSFYASKNQLKYFSIIHEIEEILTIINPILEAHTIHLSKDFQEDITIYSRGHVLGHVVLIILQNAIDVLSEKVHPLENRWIHLQVYKNEQCINIMIEDNGGGIDFKHLEGIHAHTKISHKGFGMGLQLATYLVQEHLLGTLSIENHNEGARFTISFQSLNKI